jgi:hypothetical protein
MSRYGDGVKPSKKSVGWYSTDQGTKDPLRPDRSVDNAGNPVGRPRQLIDVDEHAGDKPEALPKSGRFS